MKTAKGFTLIELMMVVTMIGILAAIAIPSYRVYTTRAILAEAFSITSEIKASITEFYKYHGSFPLNNDMAGISKPGSIRGSYVTAVEVDKGAIHVTLKFQANKKENHLSFRPLTVDDNPLSAVFWVCGENAAPKGMRASGENRTDIEDRLMPSACR